MGWMDGIGGPGWKLRMENAFEERGGGACDLVGGRALAMWAVATLVEDRERRCRPAGKRSWAGPFTAGKRRAKRLELTWFGARIPRAVNDHGRHLQVTEPSTIEILCRRCGFLADPAPRARVHVDQGEPPIAVVVCHDRSDAAAE